MLVETGADAAGAGAPIDLLLGRASGMKAAMAQVDWRAWRAPAALGGGLRGRRA